MSKLIRFGVSLPESLLKKFDGLMKRSGHSNRSEALRDLIREKLVGDEWDADTPSYGTISIVYDHHHRGLQSKLTKIQHDHGDLIVATTHVHIDHDNCLEVLIVRGKAGKIQNFANSIIGTKGVLHGALSRNTSAKKLS
jgi:CopG family transcriptional regulator, nickel-responsive regulator